MVSFTVRDQADLLVGLRRLQEQGVLSEANEVERSLVVTMISELATNIMKYAGHGTMRVARVKQAESVDIEIWAQDQGPGIESVDRAMRDHFTTGNTLGLGLPGVRRMADHFEIQSAPGEGTQVHARRRVAGRRADRAVRTGLAPASPAPLPAARSAAQWEIGLSTRPMPGERACGDLAMALELENGLLLAMIDGTGHGARGQAAAERMQGCLETTARSELRDTLEAAHQALQGTAGAAAGLLFVAPHLRHARYAGVGNTGICRRNGRPWRPVSRDGVLGQRLPRVLEQGTEMERDDLVVLWTDGLSGMPEALTPRDALRPAQDLADMLVRTQGKPHDDAGCVVLRWRS
jgi:anti-sigma regulatory factor (Ser/Thr protein kinase)